MASTKTTLPSAAPPPILLPPGWEVLYTPEGKVYYADHGRGVTQWYPPRRPLPPAPPPVDPEFVAELKDMFPSWDDMALVEVVEGCGGDREAAVDQLLSWTAEDATPVKHKMEPVFSKDAAMMTMTVLRRDRYDEVMALRLSDKVPAKAVRMVLKAVSILKRKASEAKVRTASKQSLTDSTSSLTIEDDHQSREDKIVEGQNLLKQRLDFLGLTDVQMQDDGNCQLRALAHELYNSQSFHLKVREKVVEHLQRHVDHFAGFVGTQADFDSYLATMAKDRTWGDELTLQAACDAYDVEIHLISTEKAHYHLHYSPTAAASSPPRRRLFLSYISPIHYNVVAPAR